MGDKIITESGSSWPNSYLAALENKSKPRLLHELGEGQPCLLCGDKCSGFSLHYWRKVCRNCHCGKEEHDVIEDYDPGVRQVGKLFDRYPEMTKQVGKINNDKASAVAKGTSTSRTPVALDKGAPKYEWMPPGAPEELALRYMELLPKEKQPIKGSKGAAYRKRQFEKQLPNHDLDPTLCHDLPANEAALLDEFVDNVKQNVVGQGELFKHPTELYLCRECHEPMFVGELAISASRAEPDYSWHPECFVCNTCDELLVDLIYFYKDGNIYCGRHFADSVMPRCAACDEMIFAKEYTQADGQSWHVKHFCCYQCDQPLAGRRYVPRDSNPYCLECYDKVFAKVCLTCDTKIAADAQRITFNECNFHATQGCFRCTNCKVSLVKSRFVAKGTQTFCSRECRETFTV